MAVHSLSIAQRKRLLNPKAYRRPDHRQSASQRGYDRDWRELRDAYLRAHPLCEKCRKAPATTVHHIKPVEEFPELRLVWRNLEANCRPCHEAEHGRAEGESYETYETAEQPETYERREL
jgi:5-methylcytosine-specific restriction protein A